MTSERAIKNEIKKALDRFGIMTTAEVVSNTKEVSGWRYMPVSTGYGEAGIPDFVCCVNGRMLGVEAKNEKGKQTARQKLVEKAIKAAGGDYFVVRSGKEMEAILLALDEMPK